MKKKQPCFILAGGGTAGHINPALAVARVLRDHHPEAAIYFLTTACGLEHGMALEAGFEALPISAGSLPQSAIAWPRFILSTAAGFFRALGHLLVHRPDAVLGTGGYVMVPLCLSAAILRIPLFLHEQNAFPGRANRLFSRFAKGICLSFPGSEQYFTRKRLHFRLSGNPIAAPFFSQDREEARRKLELSTETELVLIMGGSLGSKAINEAVQSLPDSPGWKELTEAHPQLRIVLSSGKVNHRFVDAAKEPSSFITILPYLDSSLWMPAADFLIGRSGAGFLMETAACGKPSILIPFPNAMDDHQRLNAECFCDGGASILLPEKELSGSRLLQELKALLEDPERLRTMSQAARQLARPKAAEDIAALLEEEAAQ